MENWVICRGFRKSTEDLESLYRRLDPSTEDWGHLQEIGSIYRKLGPSIEVNLGWLAGWLAGWMDGWLDGWMAGWICRWVSICRYRYNHIHICDGFR